MAVLSCFLFGFHTTHFSSRRNPGCTPEKHIMRSDGKSCLVSYMNSTHPFFHVRQYVQKELMLTCFNFTDTENLFSSVGAFSFHLKKKNLCRIILAEMATHKKPDCLFTPCYIHYSTVSENFCLIKYE